jgi:hypothetical protein
VLLGLLTVLLFRQFGLAFMRSRDRVLLQGLDVGGKAPAFSLVDSDGRERHVRFGPENGGGPTFVLFALPTCEVCAGLARSLATLPSERPHARFVWVDGSSRESAERGIDELQGWVLGSATGDAVHRQWEVSAVPFAFVVGANGRIVDKRLVNRRQDVEQALGIADPDSVVLTSSVRSESK